MRNDLITIFEYYHFNKLCAHDILLFNDKLIKDSNFKKAYENFNATVNSIKNISMTDKYKFIKNLEYISNTN